MLRVNTTSGLVLAAARVGSVLEAGSTKILEGLTFRRMPQHPRGGLYYATSKLGVIGIDVQWPAPGATPGGNAPGVPYPVAEATAAGVARWPQTLIAGDVLDDKIGDLFILHGADYGSGSGPDLLFALLDNARLIRVFDMDSGRRVGSWPTPGPSTNWEGIYVHSARASAPPPLELWLACDTPSQLWRFAFSLEHGIASCA